MVGLEKDSADSYRIPKDSPTSPREIISANAETDLTSENARAELEARTAALAAAQVEIRRLRDAIVSARFRLAKGRSFWNGPCHECDGVLEKALIDPNLVEISSEPSKIVQKAPIP